MITTKNIREKFALPEVMFKGIPKIEQEKLAISFLIDNFGMEQQEVIDSKIDGGKKGWDNIELKYFFTCRLRARALEPLTKENLLHIGNLAMMLWNMKE